jgi:membrane-associated protein
MEWVQLGINFIIHIDEHLFNIVSSYASWTYAILFLIIFAETGLVVTPFLPGDSLLFAAGSIAATGVLDPLLLFFLLFGAAILGDFVNYSVGSYLGLKIFKQDANSLK